MEVREYVTIRTFNTVIPTYIDFDGTQEDFTRQAKKICEDNIQLSDLNSKINAPCVSGDNWFYRYGMIGGAMRV